MKLKAVYTVEAAFIISFSFLIFGAAVALSYKVFLDGINYVSYEKEFDAVSTFRAKEEITDLKDLIMGE